MDHSTVSCVTPAKMYGHTRLQVISVVPYFSARLATERVA
jgi:hypothetical protein